MQKIQKASVPQPPRAGAERQIVDLSWILQLLLKQAIYVESSSHASQANDEDILNPKTSTRWQRRRTTIKVRNLEPNHRAQVSFKENSSA